MDLQAGYESMVFVADEGLPIDGARIQLTHFFSDVKAKSWGSSRFTMSGGNTSRKWEWRFSDIVYDRMSLSDYCKHHVILSSSANEVVCVNANGGASEEDTRPVVEFAFWSKSRDLDDQTPTATALGVNNVRSSVMSSSGGYESGSGDARSSRVRGEGSEETNGSSSTTTQQPSILQTRPSTHLDPSSSTVVPPLPPRKTSDANIFVRSVAAMRNTASSSPADSQSAKNTTSSSPPISTTSSSTNPIINIPASIIASLTSGKSSLSRSATKPPPVSSAINDGPVDDGPLFRETSKIKRE